MQGKDTCPSSEFLLAETDTNIEMACIGTAGEKRVLFASIMKDKHRGRATGDLLAEGSYRLADRCEHPALAPTSKQQEYCQAQGWTADGNPKQAALQWSREEVGNRLKMIKASIYKNCRKPLSNTVRLEIMHPKRTGGVYGRI